MMKFHSVVAVCSPVMTETTGSAFCLRLRNESRTCYSNSATATLTSLRSFRSFLSKHRASPSPLLQELISLCGVRPGEVASTARLRELVTEINRDHQDWTQTGQEQDVTEFIDSLLKALRSELGEGEVCELDRLFQSKTQLSYRCESPACDSGPVSPPADVQRIFQLPIEGCGSLLDCWAKYFFPAETEARLEDYRSCLSLY